MNMLEGILVLLRVTHSTILTLKSFQDQQEMSMIKESIKVKQMLKKIVSFHFVKYFDLLILWLFYCLLSDHFTNFKNTSTKLCKIPIYD